MTPSQLLIGLVLYAGATRACLTLARGRWRMRLFALLNLVASWVFLYPMTSLLVPRKLAYYGIYIALVLVQYAMLARFARRGGLRPWLAFFTPLAALVFLKYVPPMIEPLWVLTGRQPFSFISNIFLGLSYMAFRASALVLDVRNGVVARPGLSEYLGFCFFTPTMSVGPINSYQQFQKGFSPVDRTALPLGRCLLRVAVGAVKFIFLAHICSQLAYDGFLLDGQPHRWMDLVVAAVAFYLFLYCNFAGFCDMAIGFAGILGFPVEENFNDPFAARNIQELWNRWHITLSTYMRNVLFAPLCKSLIRLLGPARANSAIALSIFVIFALIGVWHGAAWHFLLFGALHGLAVVVVHFYGVELKRRLGKEGYKRYLQNRWIRAAAVAVTFAYMAASLFTFANDFDDMRRIWDALV